jgi:hypothetical protein
MPKRLHIIITSYATILLISGRYIGSEPSCLAAPQEDGTCRPGQVASNATIYGPDGMPKYNVTNVYIDVCPCGQGLFCDRNSGGVCKRST